MAEGLSEVEIQADEHSRTLFDRLVEIALIGRSVVVVEWDTSETSEGNESAPKVLIDGKPVLNYAKRVLEWSSVAPDVIDATGPALESKIASMWDATVEVLTELGNESTESPLAEVETGEMTVNIVRSGMGEVIQVLDGKVVVWGWAKHIDPGPGDAPEPVVRGLINEIDRLRQRERTPALSGEQVESATGFKLAMIFTEFERDGFVSPDVHEERERLSKAYYEDNVMTSFFTNEEGIVRLGLFIRSSEDGSTVST